MGTLAKERVNVNLMLPNRSVGRRAWRAEVGSRKLSGEEVIEVDTEGGPGLVSELRTPWRYLFVLSPELQVLHRLFK